MKKSIKIIITYVLVFSLFFTGQAIASPIFAHDTIDIGEYLCQQYIQTSEFADHIIELQQNQRTVSFNRPHVNEGLPLSSFWPTTGSLVTRVIGNSMVTTTAYINTNLRTRTSANYLLNRRPTPSVPRLYFTIDITAHRARLCLWNGHTNLPNPRRNIEWLSAESRFHEAEYIAQGNLTRNNYVVQFIWRDLRTGNINHGGSIELNSEASWRVGNIFNVAPWGRFHFLTNHSMSHLNGRI